MHEDELAMNDPDPTPAPGARRRFRVAKVLAAGAAVATLGLVGASVATADDAGTSGTTKDQVRHSSVDTDGIQGSGRSGQHTLEGDGDCPFKSGSGTSAFDSRG